MHDREELQTILEDILGSDHVYFQPPESIKLSYPAIIYSRSTIVTTPADDLKYFGHTRYSVTLIGKSPCNEAIIELLNLPMCSYDRHFTSDHLHHDVFNLYY